MDVMESEYNNYWDTKTFLEAEELHSSSWIIGEASSQYYSSSSSVVATSPPSVTPPKYLAMERNRREKLKEKLYALRSVVPNITKMDKASIIKDAIDYIQLLQEQEKTLLSEISELELSHELADIIYDMEEDDIPQTSPNWPLDPGPSIEVLELKVFAVGNKNFVVSVTCNKKRDTLIKMCEVFESLNLKIITANIISSSESHSHMLFIETDELDGSGLKEKIEAAIAGLDVRRNPWFP